MTPILPASAPSGDSGPVRRAPGRRVPAAALVAVGLALAGCATGGGAGPGPDPGGRGPAPDEPAGPGDRADAPSAVLEEVTRLAEAGRPADAALLADSLYFRTLERGDAPGTAADALRLQARALEETGDVAAAADRLRELLDRYPGRAGADAPLRLARLLIERAEDPGAAEVLLRRSGDGGRPAADLAHRAAQSMSAAEIEAVLGASGGASGRGGAVGGGEDGGPGAVRAALLAELAVARARAGRPDGARDAARRALEADADGEATARAGSVLDGSVGPREGPVRIGLLAPTSGRFAPVGERLREGVELAIGAHGDGLPPVEVTTVDTGEEAAEILRLVRRLEEQGVAAVIGPVRSDALSRAARARSDPGLLLLSPTAGSAPEDVPGVYTLRDEARGEIHAARSLGRWVVDLVGSGPVGAVYPAGGAGRRAYLAFRAEVGTGGGWIASAHPYDPDATTLEGPITAVSAFEPRAVFAPGGSGSSVLQMAPQLSYYGVRGAIVAGGPSWSRPSTVRRLEPSFSQHRVVAAFVDTGDGSGGWERFRSAYEREHRRSVPGNRLPALAHDAALLILRALRDARPVRPRAVARRAAAGGYLEGATGRLRLDPGTASAERRVRIRALRDRELAPASAEEAREWLRSAGGLETPRTRSRRQRAARAVRESGILLDPPADGGG